MYRIGEFSRIAKTTVKTLRHYDEAGLLAPSRVDEWTGYRYYTTDQLRPLARIVALRQAGLSVLEIRQILSGADALPILEGRRDQLRGERDDAHARLLRIEAMLDRMKEGKTMEYQQAIKTIDPCTVYFKQGIIRDFGEMGAFIIGSADECLAANPDLKCAEPGYCFVRYLDGEFRDRDISIEYAQAVVRKGVETETIRFRELPATSAVCVYHRGAYSQIGAAYAAALEYVQANGLNATDLPRERYIDGVWNREREEDYLTEIQIPIG